MFICPGVIIIVMDLEKGSAVKVQGNQYSMHIRVPLLYIHIDHNFTVNKLYGSQIGALLSFVWKDVSMHEFGRESSLQK